MSPPAPGFVHCARHTPVTAALLLAGTFFAGGCVGTRAGPAGTPGPRVAVDILGLPQRTENGGLSNRNRIYQRPATPPAPAAPPSPPAGSP